MNKLKLHSPNLTQDKMAHLRNIFPECITEAKDKEGYLKLAIDFDQLRQELSESIVEGLQERYHLNWPGKREALLTANLPISKTLRPCREESVLFDTTKNLFIQGDNLDALKLLQETYLGKVKMIYIDPPYNTGNDFIYEDNFTENAHDFLKRSHQKDEKGHRLVANTETNGRFHSDWLSMIYPRLKLARNLLKEDGMIFISIDDHEVHNLRKVCDEIFGESNFLANIVWANKEGGGSSDSIFYKVKHEYILCYSKCIGHVKILGEAQKENKSYSHEDEFKNERGKYKLIKLNSFSIQYSAKLDYPITTEAGEVIYPSENGKKGCWRWSKEKYQWGLKNGFIVIKKGQNGSTTIYTKQYFKVDNENKPIERTLPPSALINEYSSTMATKQLEQLFGKKYFDYSKPYLLIQKLIKNISAKDDNDIILDFFAGSATTAHAVMDLNAKERGNRKFILVQIPEPCTEKSEAFKAGYRTIAEISKERIRRAGKKVVSGQWADPLPTFFPDIGFRVLKIDSPNMADVYSTPDTLTQNDLSSFVDHIKPDRTSEDLLFQVLLDSGIDLSLPIRQEIIRTEYTEKYKNSFEVFFVDHNALLACFDTGVNEELLRKLAKFQPLRMVFLDKGFESDAIKMNMKHIFKQMSPSTEVKSI